MPIEIKEIIIRTRIEENTKKNDPADLRKLKNEILQECLKFIKNNIAKQSER